MAGCGWIVGRLDGRGPYTGYCYLCKADIRKGTDRLALHDKMEAHMKDRHGQGGQE